MDRGQNKGRQEISFSAHFFVKDCSPGRGRGGEVNMSRIMNREWHKGRQEVNFPDISLCRIEAKEEEEEKLECNKI